MKMKLFLTTAILVANFAYAKAFYIKSIQSNFKQTIINEKNSKIVYQGKMSALADKNLALWEYTSPIHKKIYYEGDGKVVIFEPELEQVIFAKLGKVPNVLKLISSAKEIAPNRLKTKFNGITYYINLNGDKISSISYTDEMKNRVTIEFLNERVNTNINKNIFAYIIPKGYDILEQN